MTLTSHSAPAVGALAITSLIANYPGVKNDMPGDKLLDQMRERRLQPDTITYTSVIAACAKGGETGGAARALQFLEPPSPTTLPLGGTWQFAFCGKLTPVPNTPPRAPHPRTWLFLDGSIGI